MCLLKRS